MSLSANRNYGEYGDFEMAAAVIIDVKDLVGLNSSGYLRRFTLGDKFVGMADESADNTSGANSARNIRVLRGENGTFRLRTTISGASLSDAINQVAVYATDHETLSLREGQCIGYIEQYLESGEVIIVVETNAKDTVIAETVVIGDFTDNANTTGYVDLAVAIPEGAVVLGAQFDVRTGFTGDTSALADLGIAGTLEKFVSDVNVLAVNVVGESLAVYCDADQTVRLTVTGSNDFGDVSAGEVDVRIMYSNRLQVG